MAIDTLHVLLCGSALDRDTFATQNKTIHQMLTPKKGKFPFGVIRILNIQEEKKLASSVFDGGDLFNRNAYRIEVQYWSATKYVTEAQIGLFLIKGKDVTAL